jgi:hypothetical protein
MGSRSSHVFVGGVAGLIACVLIPIVFLTSLMGAAAQTCAAADTPEGRGGPNDPIGISAMEIARKVYRAGLDTKHGEREILTAFAVVLVESGGGVTMRNPPESDSHWDSAGAFQQRDIPPWNRRNRMNVYEAALSFFEALDGFDHGQSIGELAADIQRPLESLRFKYALALPRARYFYARISRDLGPASEGLGSITAPGTSCGGGPVGPLGTGKIGPDNDVIPPANAPPRVRKVIRAANRINHLPYVWGGGHGSFVDARGYDCSGAVGYALHAGGFQTTTMVSGQYGSWGKPGPGRWITVYSNAGHVWMVVAGVRFDTSSYEAVSSGEGPRWRTGPRPTAGFVQTHPGGF